MFSQYIQIYMIDKMNLRELSPELAKKARDELFEVPSRIPNDIQAIKEWLAKQPHINARTDDQWLIAFLRGCKYSLERTKEKLDMFYTVKSVVPELCTPIDPMSTVAQEILNAGVFLPLPKTIDPAGPRHAIVRFGQLNPDRASLIDLLRVNFLIIMILFMEDDNFVVAGQIEINDWTGVSMKFLTQMTPTLMKKLVVASQDSVPMRQKGSHHVNVPSLAETIFNFAKQFMNEKNKSRLFVYKDMEELHKRVSKTILPAEYGGDSGSTQDLINYWKKKVEDYRDFFIEEANYKTDESKRIGKPKTSETLFGIEGSFRQLNVD